MGRESGEHRLEDLAVNAPMLSVLEKAIRLLRRRVEYLGAGGGG